jgi:hypothetical protein
VETLRKRGGLVAVDAVLDAWPGSRSRRGHSHMTSSQIDAGTPILELDAQEYAAFLDREAQARMGMSAEGSSAATLRASWRTWTPTCPCSSACWG